MPRTASQLQRAVLGAVALAVLLPVGLAGPAGTASAALPAGPPAQADPAPSSSRPNVLVIKTDDQVMERLPQLRAYMPKLAAFFAENGREFTNSYVSSPSCCQSRASTFVGRYPHNEGVWSQGKGATLDTRGGLAPYLQRAGYRTGIVGKYLNLVYADIPGYDWWTTIRGTCTGLQTESCASLGTDPNWYYNFTVTSNSPHDPAAEHVVPGNPETGAGYNTRWSGERFRRYLGAAAAGRAQGGAPWYLEWDPTAPHTHDKLSLMAEPKYRDAAVPGCTPPVEADRSDKPAFVRAFPVTQGRYAATAVCPATQRALLSLDDEFAKIVRQLEVTGSLADTLIVFTSDNGLMNGEHSMTRKFVAYEPSVRVPLLLSWPGRVAVGTDDRLASNVDILPTVLEAAGVPADPALPALDGRSLLSGDGHRVLLSEYRLDRGWTAAVPAPIPTWAAMTDSHTKYVEVFTDVAGSPAAVGSREFYDLDRDPGELENLLGDGDPANDPDVGALHARLAALRTCAGTGPGPGACP